MSKQKSRVRLTAGRVSAHTCPDGKSQAFLWDTDVPTLALRATPGGRRTYVFESRLDGATLRITIGPCDAWTIDQARNRARQLKVQVDQGIDPREVDRQRQADAEAKRLAQLASALTVGEVWPRYMAEGRPKRRAAWKPRYRADLEKAASPGGLPKKRGKGTTKPGHLAALMPLPLASIDQDTIRDWYAGEAKTAPVQAARAIAMFSGFLGWCATQKDFRDLVDREAALLSRLGDILPRVERRRDALEIDQLQGWFSGTDKLRNKIAAAYLQALVLTGARREEMAALRWADVDFRWRKLTLADKVDDTRTIPLTPYMEALLSGLPEYNQWIFASMRPAKSVRGKRPALVQGSASGHIKEPRAPHREVLADAGIPHVSIHGLRRTFSLMGEAAGAPAGAIAQIMGHKPSAVAEGYRPRSVDALRPFLAQIEQFILDKAGVAFEPVAKPARGVLRAVV